MRLLPLLLIGCSATAATVTPDEATARLRMAMQIAHERNDKALVSEVEQTAQEFKTGGGDDEKLRAIETKVGIEPGGWSMADQPLFHPTVRLLAKVTDGTHSKLNAAPHQFGTNRKSLALNQPCLCPSRAHEK